MINDKSWVMVKLQVMIAEFKTVVLDSITYFFTTTKSCSSSVFTASE